MVPPEMALPGMAHLEMVPLGMAPLEMSTIKSLKLYFPIKSLGSGIFEIPSNHVQYMRIMLERSWQGRQKTKLTQAPKLNPKTTLHPNVTHIDSKHCRSLTVDAKIY